MRIKLSYLAAMLTVAAVSFAGCSNNDEPNNGGGVTPPPSEITFDINVSEVTPSTLKLVVTPSDDQIYYFASLMGEDIFLENNTEEAFQVYLDEYFDMILEQAQAQDPNITIEDVRQQLCATDMLTVARVDFLVPERTYYFVAVGVDVETGLLISKLSSKKQVMPVATGDAPTIEVIEVMAGDFDGKNPTTMITGFAGTTGAVYGRCAFENPTLIDNAIADGATLVDILDIIGGVLNDTAITDLNNMDAAFEVDKLTPNTKVAFLLQVVGAGGKSVVERADGATAASASPQKIGQMSSVVKGQFSSFNKKMSKVGFRSLRSLR